MYLHIDMNSFFASCEILKHPYLRNKPVIVTGGVDFRTGMVLAATYEAKRKGIYTTMPVSFARRKCKPLYIRRADITFYRKISKYIFTIIGKLGYYMERASIDECYLYLQSPTREEREPISSEKEAYVFAEKLQSYIYDTVGLQTSIGVGTTKFYAKTGSDYKKPMGITVISKVNFRELLGEKELIDIHGIGKKAFARFLQCDIRTLNDLYAFQHKEQLQMLFGDRLDEYFALFNGTLDSVMIGGKKKQKSQSVSETFYKYLETHEEVERGLLQVFETLLVRRKSKTFHSISVFYTSINQSKSKIVTIDTEQTEKEIIDLIFQTFLEIWDDCPIVLLRLTEYITEANEKEERREDIKEMIQGTLFD